MEPSLTVAICTRERPADLEDCLSSVLVDQRVSEVLVSSDGLDLETDSVINRFVAEDARVQFLRGPRIGLAANRNVCIANCSSEYILFLDDDARLQAEFLTEALRQVTPTRIITGWEIKSGRIVEAHNADFFGYQRKDPRGQLRAIVINSTIFPALFLKSRPFDEFYRYGSEEIDMAIAATSNGLTIEKVAAGNIHLHSPSSRSGNEIAAILSNIHFCVRRYREYERSYMKLTLYLLLGPPQTLRAFMKLVQKPKFLRALFLTMSGLLSGLRGGGAVLSSGRTITGEPR